MGIKNNRASIKQLTVCSMLVALGVIFLGVGSLVEVLDISMTAVASFCVIISVIEYGKGAPWLVYAATSVLSFILIPHNKLPAIAFACFFGFYPILKEKLDKKSVFLQWILKEIIFNVSLAAIIGLCFLIIPEYMSLDLPFAVPLPLVIAVTVILCEVVFILYDIAIKRITAFYVIKLRHRFKFK